MAAVHHRNATALAALRIFVGIFFLLFGEYKVFGTEFTLHGGFEESIRGFLEQGAYPWMAPVLRHVVLPHAHLWAFLTAYGELLIGLGLIFGVLTRLASIFGLLLMVMLWLSAGYPGPHVALWRYFGAFIGFVRLCRVFRGVSRGRARAAVVIGPAPAPKEGASHA
jgi:uncharacterized membrane protein YphA (DoxX/SURF4 family)